MPLQTVLGGVALACVAGRVEAADARLQFSIPSRTYADALIDLGLQANISILGTSACGGDGAVQLAGRYTLEEALDRLLASAPCRYRIVDARTVRILPAQATSPQSAPDHEAERAPSLISEVVVTATKRPTTLDRVAAGVSAIPREQLVTTRANDVSQTVGQMAGVITTNLGPGRDKLLIRGLSDGAFTGRTRSTVATYLDDAPINSNAPDPDLRLTDVERVEVVRGPQGALYGAGSIAGIYRIVTRKPDLEKPEGGASAAVAATKGGDPSNEFEAYLSLPVVRGVAAVRIAAYKEVQGGYLDDSYLGVANVDQTRRDGGRLAVRLQLAENWRFDAMAATQHLRSNDTQYVLAGTMTTGGDSGLSAYAETTASAPDERRNRVREAHNNDFAYAGGALNGSFGWGDLTATSSYVHHVFSSQFDASAVLEPQGALGGLVATPEAIGAYVESTRSNMFVADVVARSSGRGRLDWLVGAYASRTVEDSPSTLGVLTAGPVVTTAYTEARKDRIGEVALYGEVTYRFGAGWSATVGGRLFETHVDTTAALDVVAPYGPRGFDKEGTYRGFSPKVSIQREFANGDLIYALLSDGYRPGGFNTSGFYAIRESRTTFEPDRLRNIEAGVKLRRFDGRLGLRAAAYYDDWSNIQTDQYRRSGLAYTANVGDARIIGLEAEASYDWPFGLSLQLNGLLSDSHITNPNSDFAVFDASMPVRVTGDLPGVPNTSGGILAVYERAVGGGLSLRLVGEANYVGRSALSFDARLPPTMGHYLRARLSAEIASPDWRITAFVTNPFDEAGDTFAYGNPFNFGQVRQVTPQRPRTVGVRLAAAF